MSIKYNLILIALIVLGCFFLIYQFIKKNKEDVLNETIELQKKDINYLVQGVKDTFNSILKVNIAELTLNKYETLKTERSKTRLRQSIRNCAYGDMAAKEYVKDHIKEIIQKKYGIDESTIDESIPFPEKAKLTIQDKFEIVLYQCKKERGYNALKELILQNKLHEKDKIQNSDIEKLYVEVANLEYVDKIEILAQRIYQMIYGHGVIDEIRDMEIDGVSAGVSGIPHNACNNYSNFLDEAEKMAYSYDSIWIFFQGNTMQLSFLSFGTQRELERVSKNVYKYDNPGQLSAEKGYIVNEMKDGSRVVVVRPPFAESWAFFIRKFDSIKKAKVEDLITDQENHIPIETMEWIIRGCQVIGITGTQGCGKSTLLMSLIQFINKSFNLRVQELAFELWLRKLYPFRNILTFRETGSVTGQEGLDLQKKTDGDVNILGEIATALVASWLIQVAQVASVFTMFTHHAKTTETLIDWMRNALLKEGGFQNETIAEEQVVKTINFDIHMNRVKGHRYIERITEIVPMDSRNVIHNYKTVDIVIYENGRYVLKNNISKNRQKDIMNSLDKEEKEQFLKFFQGVAYGE